MGRFARFESRLAQYVESGSSVSVNIRLVYGTAEATRPDMVVYQAVVDGRVITHFFSNL